MKKLLALLSVAGMVAMWSGCGLTDPSPTSVSITIESIGAVVVGGAAGQVTGKIEADSALTNVEMTVLNSSDVDVKANFTVSFTSGYSDKKTADLKTDMSTTVAAKAGTAAGTYKLKITAESGGISSSSTKEFAVTGGNTSDLVLDTATLGNTQNTTAGTIDLDNGSLYKADEITASNVGSIDICYANGSSTDRFYVAKAAKYGTTDDKTIKTSPAGFAFTSSWPETGYANDVRINTITSAQYDATTTKAAAAALWSASNALVYAPVTDGAAFLVKTSSGAYVLMKVLAYTAGITGTVQFKYAQ